MTRHPNDSGWQEYLFVLFLFATFVLTYVARADDKINPAALLPKCQSALSACDVLRDAQDAQAVVLKDSVKQWKKIATAPRYDLPLAFWTTVAGTLGGAAAGQVAGSQLAAGALTGGIVGLAVGLVFGK